jgi:hypothetical protein
MAFIHPYWLFGLLAIAIPILIHLFNFRRYRKYYFTNLKFLKSIKKETKKQHRLRHLLILIARILTIIALVMAFARPYFPGPQDARQTESVSLSIYMDNSMSMQASSNGHQLLDEALAMAAEVAKAYDASDRFQLITNEFKGKHQAYFSKDEFIKLLAEVKPTPKRRMLEETFERFNELKPLSSDEEVHLFIISDFQQSTMDISCLEKDSSSKIFLMPVLGESLANVFIDSAWFEYPVNHIGQRQELNVRFVNASDNRLEKIPVTLMINNSQRGLAGFDIEAGKQSSLKIPFTNRESGIQSGILSIDDYPITWDDKMYLSWEVKPNIPSMTIYEESPGFYLSSLLSNDSVFDYSERKLKSLDYGAFHQLDFIVLDNITSISTGLSSELLRFIESGGSLLLIPGKDADLLSINAFLKTMNAGQLNAFDTTRLMVTGINTSHELFNDVFESIPENLDLPLVRAHYPLTSYRPGITDVIMDLQNADPLLSMNEYGKGKFYLMSGPLGDEYGNLARHAIWVPLIYRMAMLSRPPADLYYSMGEDKSIIANVSGISDEVFKVKNTSSDYEFIPGIENRGGESLLHFYDMIKDAGHYEIISADDRVQGFAFNYDRLESFPEIYSPQALDEWIATMDNPGIFLIESDRDAVYQSVTEISRGTELWKFFIWIALFFILLEILLLRSFRK